MIWDCKLWSTENVQWGKANWTWAECEIVQEICQIWSTAGMPWIKANWRWSECTGSIPPVPIISVGNLPGVDAETLIQPWQLEEEPWNPYQTSSIDKQRRLIKLICKVKNKEYREEKEVKDFPVKTGDIKLVVRTVSGIDLEIGKTIPSFYSNIKNPD